MAEGDGRRVVADCGEAPQSAARSDAVRASKTERGAVPWAPAGPTLASATSRPGAPPTSSLSLDAMFLSLLSPLRGVWRTGPFARRAQRRACLRWVRAGVRARFEIVGQDPSRAAMRGRGGTPGEDGRDGSGLPRHVRRLLVRRRKRAVLRAAQRDLSLKPMGMSVPPGTAKSIGNHRHADVTQSVDAAGGAPTDAEWARQDCTSVSATARSAGPMNRPRKPKDGKPPN